MQAEPTSVPVQLSEGQSQLQTVEPLPQATGVPLSDEEIDQVLARLPKVTVEPQDQVDFNLANEPIHRPKQVRPSLRLSPCTAGCSARGERGRSPGSAALRPEGEIPIAPL